MRANNERGLPAGRRVGPSASRRLAASSALNPWIEDWSCSSAAWAGSECQGRSVCGIRSSIAWLSPWVCQRVVAGAIAAKAGPSAASRLQADERALIDGPALAEHARSAQVDIVQRHPIVEQGHLRE